MIYIILLIFLYSFYEYRNIKIKQLKSHDFNIKTIKNKRIVFVSDIQYDFGNFFFLKGLMGKVVRMINSQNPDIVVFGGDFIHHTSKYVFDYLKDINAEKIGVLGNHDYRDLENTIYGCEKANIRLLINENYQTQGLNFIGLDDLKKGSPKLPAINHDDYNILLVHEPDDFENYDFNYQFGLAGHLHAGLITFFGIFAPVLPSKLGQKYRYALVNVNGRFVYVSSGLGGFAFILPIRFFARPEIVVIDI